MYKILCVHLCVCVLQGAAENGGEIRVNLDLWREARKGS